MSRIAFAPAKLNLFLHVGPPQADGYHPLCSLMAFADIGDRVSAPDGDSLSLSLLGPFAGQLDGGADNLVMRAAQALLSELRRPCAPARLVLDKRLPVASGLGGGSSDAGAALRLLRAVWAADMPDAALQAVAASLGADGAACLWGRPVLAEGRGERISPAPGLPVIDAVLVNPNVAVSTGAVYARLDAQAGFGDVAPPLMPAAFESVEEVAAWLSTMRNDLQGPAIDLAPEVSDVLGLLAEEPETLMARMTGSGATCFALCPGDVEAEGLAERIEALRPDWWVRRCRLGGPWSLDEAH